MRFSTTLDENLWLLNATTFDFTLLNDFQYIQFRKSFLNV